MKKISVKFALILFIFLLANSSIMAKAKKSKIPLDSKEAITTLAPVTRKATKPGEGVYYSLFVRAFADGNRDGIGDFKGIIKKLDYLNDGDDSTTSDLGITGIWLLPICRSPSYHGYDIDDYYNVNPDYGTMEDFEKLVAECKKRGINVIIDMTCNHSSATNLWFTQSKDKNSPYRTWYRWLTDLDFTENGGKYLRTQKGLDGNIWKIDLSTTYLGDDGKPIIDSTGQQVCQYYAGLFSTQMPDFNMDNPNVRAEFKKIFKYWMDKGVSGFRFDAGSHVYNIAEVEPGTPALSKGIDFWKEMSGSIKEINPESYCVVEVWENSAIRAQYAEGMQSNFHFGLGELIASTINNQEANDNNPSFVPDSDTNTYNGYSRSLRAELDMFTKNNANYIDAPFLSNHDQARSCVLFNNKLPKMKLAADMYILSEGIPFIYYGEEIGMKSGKDDPTKRTPLIWNKEGKDKLTSKWCDNGNYKNVNVYNKKTISVAEQSEDPESLLNHYKRVIRVKTAHPALLRGRVKPVSLGSPVLESYAMEVEEEVAFVIHNISSKESVTVTLPSEYNLPLVYAATEGVTLTDGVLTIPPFTSVVLAKNK